MSSQTLYALPRHGWRLEIYPDRRLNEIVFCAYESGDKSEACLSMDAAVAWLAKRYPSPQSELPNDEVPPS